MKRYEELEQLESRQREGKAGGRRKLSNTRTILFALLASVLLMLGNLPLYRDAPPILLAVWFGVFAIFYGFIRLFPHIRRRGKRERTSKKR